MIEEIINKVFEDTEEPDYEDIIEEAMKRYATWYAKQCLTIAANKAEVCFDSTNEAGEPEIYSYTAVYGDDYKYVNFDSLPTMRVNKDTITNIPFPTHQ